MSMSMQMNMHIYIHIYIYIYICMLRCIHDIFVYTYTDVSKGTCLGTHTHAHRCLRMYKHMWGWQVIDMNTGVIWSSEPTSYMKGCQTRTFCDKMETQSSIIISARLLSWTIPSFKQFLLSYVDWNFRATLGPLIIWRYQSPKSTISIYIAREPPLRVRSAKTWSCTTLGTLIIYSIWE